VERHTDEGVITHESSKGSKGGYYPVQQAMKFAKNFDWKWREKIMSNDHATLQFKFAGDGLNSYFYIELNSKIQTAQWYDGYAMNQQGMGMAVRLCENYGDWIDFELQRRGNYLTLFVNGGKVRTWRAYEGNVDPGLLSWAVTGNPPSTGIDKRVIDEVSYTPYFPTIEMQKPYNMSEYAQGTDVVITEIGGTVGDIESQPFLEAIRQVATEVGRENVLYIHVALIPFLGKAGELKSKPAQHSVKELLSIGIQPDIVVCRAERELDEEIINKLSLFCNIPPEAVIPNLDADVLYEIPLMMEREGLAKVALKKLGLRDPKPNLYDWEKYVERSKNLKKSVTIALVGKYVVLRDAYLSVVESLKHGGVSNNADVHIKEGQYEGVAMFFSENSPMAAFLDTMQLPMAHFPLMNTVFVWCALPIAACVCRKNPIIGLSGYGFLIVNGMDHLGGGAALEMTPLENPGFFTGTLIFIPLTIFMVYVCLKTKALSKKGIVLTLVSGIVGHIALASCYLFAILGFPAGVLIADVVVSFTPMIVAWFLCHITKVDK